MGAKTWVLVYADRNVGEALTGGPQLDRDVTKQLANLDVRTNSGLILTISQATERTSAKGADFPIVLPFWHKKVEDEPWLGI